MRAVEKPKAEPVGRDNRRDWVRSVFPESPAACVSPLIVGQKMSADYVVVFYGAQVALSAYDLRACESLSHPLMKSAGDAKIDTHWADFVSEGGHGFELLVGRRFGIFGPEDSLETQVERGAITRAIQEVDAFLVRVGLPAPGKLIVRLHQVP